MRPKFYLFGDSITEESFGNGGWVASLAHHYSRTADLVLRGYSGYNTRWALKVLDRVFPAKQDGGDPVAVVLFFGANDATLPDRCAAFQHVPVDKYKQNLKAIASFFKERWHKIHVLLISPPPIDEAARLEFPYVRILPVNLRGQMKLLADMQKRVLMLQKNVGLQWQISGAACRNFLTGGKPI